MIRIVSNAYSYFAQRRLLLILCICGIVLCSALSLYTMTLEENIGYMLPDTESRLNSDLDIIQSAPLQRKVIITLKAEDDDLSGSVLAKTTALIAEAMNPEFFTDVMYKPESLNPKFFIALRDMLPSLFSKEIEQHVGQMITEEEIATTLRKQKQRLGTMEGLVLSSTIAADPLNLHQNALKNLAALAYMRNIRVLHGVYMTEDGKHSLIMASTPVKVTDSKAAVALEDEFHRLFKMLPTGITPIAISAQRYTAANVLTIKDDIEITSIFACILLFLIAIIFLRTKQLFFLLLLPCLSYCAGAAAVAIGWRPASAMTFGFGPVLVGMTIDFGLHLYYILGSNTESKSELLKKASVPIVISGVTTIAAFALLMLSPVPGLRQLSAFITVGLTTALILTLFVFPHFITGCERPVASRPLSPSSPLRRVVILAVAVWFLVIGCFGVSDLHFQDHIRSLGVRPDYLVDGEKMVRKIWGTPENEALLFASGDSVDTVVHNTHESLALLPKEDATSVIGLTPLLPCLDVQKVNQEKWMNFWAMHPDVATQVQEQGRTLGFAKHAFSPFYDFLKTQPHDISLQNLRKLGVGSLVDTLLVERVPSRTTVTDGTDISRAVTLISYLPDTITVNAAFSPKVEEEYGVRLISGSRLGNELAKVLTSTFAQFIIYAFFLIIVCIAVIHRSLKQCVSALLPACFGLLMMGGVFGLLDRPLSLFSIAGALLVLGHGVDYGVYATHAIKNNSLGTSKAILVSGLTSLAGFGSLLLADHPALYDMGLSVFSGLLGAMPCALFVLPALFTKDSISS